MTAEKRLAKLLDYITIKMEDADEIGDLYEYEIYSGLADMIDGDADIAPPKPGDG